ncbi:MAG TPA: hypothetical protein VN081_04900 [Dongiaceae bacterium]|nr:hypothetical protein [Dongiaceae bacterium]
MKYTVVVATRDIMTQHHHGVLATKKLIGWQALFESLLPHLTEDIDDSPEAMYQYISGWYNDNLDDCPLDQTELMYITNLFSALFHRLRERSESFFVEIPKGFVHTIEIERWIGFDLELAFVYTQPSYSVGRQS